MSILREGSDVKVKLADFEGPLDLLLHLIRDAKLDIKTVPLASVTSQYLEYLSQLDKLNLNLASEFIEVGATLVDIKSKQILPKLVEDDEEEEDAEARLRAQLEEYKLLKEASLKMKELENVDRFYKEPEPVKEIIKFTLDGIDMDALIEAMTKVMMKIHKEKAPVEEKQIKKDRFTVADKMVYLRNRLGVVDRIEFPELFASDYSKSEVINTFLAILELLKVGEIHLEQQCQFSEISITRGEQYGTTNAATEFVFGTGDGGISVNQPSSGTDGIGGEINQVASTEGVQAIEELLGDFNIIDGIDD